MEMRLVGLRVQVWGIFCNEGRRYVGVCVMKGAGMKGSLVQ